MKNKSGHWLLTICFFISIQTVVGQSFDSVEIKTTKITESIYMLEGAGGNIGVLTGNDGIILIDDQFAPLSAKIKKALRAISDKPVKFIINTHFHGDHTGGNKNFGEEGSIIVAHENTRKRLTTDQFIAAFDDHQKAYDYVAIPKITFTESIIFHVDSQTVEIFHVKNAHTDGDAIIHFTESNVFHTGDVFGPSGLPFIDQSNGGSIDGMIAAADLLLKLVNDQSKIIPGHGKLSGKKELTEYRNMLQTIRNRVAEAIKQGKTLDQIIATNPTKEFNSFMERMRPMFVKAVYDSLKK